MLRTVTATFLDSLGRPLAGRKVYVTRVATAIKGETFYPADRHEKELAPDGSFELSLETTDDSELPTFYRWTIPTEHGSETFDTTLKTEDGSPIPLAELRLHGVIPSPAYQTILDYMDANRDRFKGNPGPQGPPGRIFTYRIKSGETLTIADGEYIIAPLLETEDGAAVGIAVGGILHFLP